ncbi:MAG TPA: class I SAM-dependent RNA methyltransferase [Clostridia bacterium]
MNIIITALMGMESLIGDELRVLGFPPQAISVQNAMVVLDAGANPASACARINLWTRCGERVLLELGQSPAADFDALFDATRNMPWEDWIANGQVFVVDGYSRGSILFGISACQSIIKKAIVDRLTAVRGQVSGGRLLEDPARGTVQIRFSIVHDVVSYMVDTSGAGLHKRGYRPLRNVAPIRESLAAALTLLSHWDFSSEAFLDPFCGSGTIPIEAALIACRIAPGLHRTFSGESWHVVGQAAFDAAREEARDLEISRPDSGLMLFGSDIDPEMVALSAENARRAGVGGKIRFYADDAVASGLDRARLDGITGSVRRLIVCNPPYGERLLDPEKAREIEIGIGAACLSGGHLRDDLRLTVISSDEGFEQTVGARADKRRKLYNGMIKCTMYHYFRHMNRQEAAKGSI